MIKQKYRISKKFWVQLVSKHEVKKMIIDLKNNSDNSDWVSKQTNISPVFKKDDPLDRDKYWRVSILSLILKVCKTLLYNQLSDHAENIFNVILCSFQKVHSTQDALLQSWPKWLDKKGMVATLYGFLQIIWLYSTRSFTN